jgi:hypothetical protein
VCVCVCVCVCVAVAEAPQHMPPRYMCVYGDTYTIALMYVHIHRVQVDGVACVPLHLLPASLQPVLPPVLAAGVSRTVFGAIFAFKTPTAAGACVWLRVTSSNTGVNADLC